MGPLQLGLARDLIDGLRCTCAYGLVILLLLPDGKVLLVDACGGSGVLDRKFGLTLTICLGAGCRVMVVCPCDASHEPDLFWALRGGGGGNFGVVTSFTFRVHQVTALSLFTLRWPWSSAAYCVMPAKLGTTGPGMNCGQTAARFPG